MTGKQARQRRKRNGEENNRIGLSAPKPKFLLHQWFDRTSDYVVNIIQARNPSLNTGLTSYLTQTTPHTFNTCSI